MNRDFRAKTAAETDAILECGGYRAPSGAWVDLCATVASAVASTRLLDDGMVSALAHAEGGHRVEVRLSNRSTLAAMAEAVGEGLETAALVFASARNPGGGYRSGAEAQEESLARASALVKTQLAQQRFYRANRGCKSLLYRDAMIWSPSVPVFRGDDGALLEAPYRAGLITAPAPNAGAIREEEERRRISAVLACRMRAVIALAAQAGAHRLVLGAWGCGVFRNDPGTVAQLWSEALANSPQGAFPAGVEMAIYDKPDSPVWRAFDAVFGAQVR